MSDMEPGELDELERLAKAATPETKGRWKYHRSIFPNDPINYAYVEWGDEDRGFGTGTLSRAMGRYIAALSPDVVLRLIAAARLQGDPGLLREARAIVDTVDALGPFRDETGDELDIEDLRAALAASPPEPEPLDVERLAKAIFHAERPDRHWPTWDEYLSSFAHGPTQADVWLRKAERVAAEYARLSKPAP